MEILHVSLSELVDAAGPTHFHPIRSSTTHSLALSISHFKMLGLATFITLSLSLSSALAAPLSVEKREVPQGEIFSYWKLVILADQLIQSIHMNNS